MKTNWKKRISSVVCMLLFSVMTALVVISAVYLVQGYRMYRAALDRIPLDTIVASYQNQASYVPLSQLPQIYKDAVVAVEDHRFYRHGGVDLISIARAIYTDLTTRSLKEGGSTITQQLAKNLYFTQERKLERKIAEMFMAFSFEKHYDKETILELYINSIYYGSGYYGILEASEGYFGEDPGRLSEEECTLLAGLPNAPSAYSLDTNPALAAKRQRQVLDAMVRYGYLTRETASEISVDGDVAASANTPADAAPFDRLRDAAAS